MDEMEKALREELEKHLDTLRRRWEGRAYGCAENQV